ncbi:DUF3606 domain-containing protein [Massilia horti]|uniref:DUF3606 domain-containing protein n=1 Tax=Massilia horti TaxID=2562153 RepID=A0A4Y9SZI1_9BURK|nr:DUF3606 domain-containing protein [Massilia horti]
MYDSTKRAPAAEARLRELVAEVGPSAQAVRARLNRPN